MKLTLLMIITSQLLRAQNLVPNPSFECGIDQCLPNQDIYNFQQYACNWSCANAGTSDTFSMLLQNKECWASMPQNTSNRYYMGSQLPRTGKRFAGIYTYTVDRSSDLYREYLEVALKTPLVEGERYCAEMYVSRAENIYFGSNNMGMYFHEKSIIDHAVYGNLPYTPQIVEHAIINDTSSWVKIAGTFQATASLQYLTIGNFYNDFETSGDFHGPNFDHYYYYAYYFIDDVAVEKLPYDEFLFSGSTALCKGKTTEITASVGVENITWTTLADTMTTVGTGKLLKVNPASTTSYRVTARGCSYKIVDTVTVTVNPVPEIDLGSDTTICEGTSLLLDAGNGVNYTWQDHSTGQYLNATYAGKYSVEVVNQYSCGDEDSIQIAVKTIPEVSLGNDTLVCSHYFPLHAGTGHLEYHWSTGSPDPVIFPEAAGKYWVAVQNECGAAVDTITIYANDNVFIPNVITPNGDGLNERFEILADAMTIPCSVTIYNRWGQNIFSDKYYKNNWPVENLASGVYYYTLHYSDCPSSKGFLHVLK